MEIRLIKKNRQLSEERQDQKTSIKHAKTVVQHWVDEYKARKSKK
jgi:hypothetical protein